MSDVKQPKIGQVWGTPSLPLSWLLVEEVKSDGIVVARWGETTRKWMALEWWQSFTGQRSVRLIHDPQERTMFHGEPQEGDIWGDPRDVYSWVLVQEIDYDRECIEVMKWGIHGTQAWTAGKWRAFTTYTGIKRVERSKEDAKPLDVEASIINLAERLDALDDAEDDYTAALSAQNRARVLLEAAGDRAAARGDAADAAVGFGHLGLSFRMW